MKSKKRKKRMTKWASYSLTRLDDNDFIDVFVTAISDRTILKTGPLEFDVKRRILLRSESAYTFTHSSGL